MKFTAFVLSGLVISTGCVRAQDATLLKRIYKPGKTSHYRLTCTEYHNNNWHKTVVSECRLTVAKGDGNKYYEEVRWLSKKEFSASDTASHDEKAISVIPYRVSLQPTGSLELPRITVPEMTQPMQDFNTFLVAVSPQLGTTALKHAGDSIVNKELVIADLSNGDFIVKGQDGFTVKMKMTGVTEDSITTKVDFLPPDKSCFPYYLEEMNRPVVENTPNNIQMVKKPATTRLWCSTAWKPLPSGRPPTGKTAGSGRRT